MEEKNGPEYYLELQKLIGQNVVSEKTAQLHVGDLRFRSINATPPYIQKSSKRRAKIKVSRILGLLLLLITTLAGVRVLIGS